MKVTAHIDYISVTYTKAVNPLPMVSSKEVKPFLGYKMAFKDSYGCLHLYEGTGGNCLIVASGKPLQEIRDAHGFDDRALLSMFLSPSELKHVTRIDSAVDIFDSGLDALSFRAEYDSGLVNQRVSCQTIDNAERRKGNTTYLGSRKKGSPRFLRGYDKAKEMRRFDLDQFRLELVTRKDGGATSLAQELRDADSVPDMIVGSINKYVKPKEGSRLYGILQSSALPHNVTVSRHENNTQSWLLSTVLKSIEKEVSNDPAFREAWIIEMQRVLGI